MEFYSAMKKNKIFLFSSKWMELGNIILSEVSRLRRPKIIHSSSYVDFRFRPNAAVFWDLGHVLRGEHKWEKCG
jgi:hypothetical protein